jgi:hypothetical protein
MTNESKLAVSAAGGLTLAEFSIGCVVAVVIPGVFVHLGYDNLSFSAQSSLIGSACGRQLTYAVAGMIPMIVFCWVFIKKPTRETLRVLFIVALCLSGAVVSELVNNALPEESKWKLNSFWEYVMLFAANAGIPPAVIGWVRSEFK